MPGQITHSEAGDRGVFALEQGGRQVAEMTYQRLGEARILVRLPAESLDLADTLQIVHEQRVHRA